MFILSWDLTPPKKFNSSPLKNDAWKTILSILGMGKLSGDVIHHTAGEYQEFSVFFHLQVPFYACDARSEAVLAVSRARAATKTQKNPTDVDGIMGI